MKNLVINTDKIIWARIIESYQSERWKWFEEYVPSWVDRKIFKEKISPAGFYSNSCFDSGPLPEDQMFKYFINGKILMVKPSVVINIQDVPTIHEEYFDAMAGAESFFQSIKSSLPDYVLCE